MPAAVDFKTIGIVFALEMEARGLRNVLSRSRRVRARSENQSAWQIGTTRVILAISGVGREKCAQATNAIIDSGARWIINAGFAAALDGKASVGDVVVANRLLLPDSNRAALVCDEGMLAAVPPSGRLGFGIWRSDVVTCDEIILQADEKRAIYAGTGAAALDMECYAAAEACAARGVSFSSIKVVSDTASEDLPKEIETLTGIEDDFVRTLFVLARPHLWRGLWRIRKHALKAADNLGDVLGMMLMRLSGI